MGWSAGTRFAPRVGGVRRRARNGAPRTRTEWHVAYPERVVPPLSPGALSSPRTSALLSRSWSTVRPLAWPFAAAWLCYLALTVLTQSPVFRVYDAGWLPYVEFLRRVTYTLAPDAFLSAQQNGAATLPARLAYLLLMAAAVGGWIWAMRAARAVELTRVVPVLVMTAVITVPLIVLPGLFSDDVYLYNLYGRTISVYGANPLHFAPSSFPADAHLPWVHWKELPSAYGPIWLMLSAALSRLGSDSPSTVIVVYRVAAVALHLLTVAALWSALRTSRSRAALSLTLFYAWNPLVLLEVVGNAHNDVLVALFAVLLVTAAMRRAWFPSTFFGACAVMVKPYALLLLAPVARQIVLQSRGWNVARQLAAASAVSVGTIVLVSLPLWAGGALLSNVLTNPASAMYTNTLWELLSDLGARWLGVTTVAIQHPYLDILRGVALFGAAVWVLTRGATRRDVPNVAFRLWLVFCLTACWVWPWYFVPALALAPLAGAARLPAATALTIGGLLFWATWPERSPWPFASLFGWRSLVLFGPVVLTLTWAPAHRMVFALLGVTRHASATDPDHGDVQLQTAAG